MSNVLAAQHEILALMIWAGAIVLWLWIVWRIVKFFIRLVTKTVKEAWNA
jgi:hypothetical protein